MARQATLADDLCVCAAVILRLHASAGQLLDDHLECNFGLQIQSDLSWDHTAYELVQGTRGMLFERENYNDEYAWDDIDSPDRFYQWMKNKFATALFHPAATIFPSTTYSTSLGSPIGDTRYRYFINQRQWAIASIRIRQLKVYSSWTHCCLLVSTVEGFHFVLRCTADFLYIANAQRVGPRMQGSMVYFYPPGLDSCWNSGCNLYI